MKPRPCSTIQHWRRAVQNSLSVRFNGLIVGDNIAKRLEKSLFLGILGSVCANMFAEP